MPQVLTVPSWYNDDTYIKNKVVECNTIKFGDQSDWSADTVKAFLAGAYGEDTYASWIGYDNFVNSGNAENCSPSPYFVVAEYLAAKAAQLNGIKYNDKTDWNQQDVLKAFNDAGITAWDHYTTSGQAENINPSNGFDTSAFFAAKCDILNTWQNEDGTTGFDGKDDWTPEDVIATFQGLGINPIMNQPDNPNAASLIIQVPSDEQVQDNGFNVWNPTGEIDYVDVPVTTDPLANVGTAANENFIADVTTSSKTSTLLSGTTIDGDGGQDMLTVNMSGNFRGFDNENALVNVEDVVLNNTTSATHYFNAKNTVGVETWTLNEQTGVIDLQNLPEAGITVNVNGLAGNKTTDISFADKAVEGEQDAMTLGLGNVGTPKTGTTAAKYAKVNMTGIEDLTVNATGDNYADLSPVTGVKNLSITGNGDIDINKADDTVATLDASASTGNIKVDLTASDMIESVEMGAGNDKVTVTKIQENAVVNGGDGNDEFVLKNLPSNAGSYELQMTDVETLTVQGPNTNVVLSGAETSGLETLKLNNMGANNLSAGYFDSGEMNVLVTGTTNTGKVSIDNMESVTFTVGDSEKVNHSFTGTLVLGDTTGLTVNVAGPSATYPAEFAANIEAGNATDLTINNAHNARTFTLGSASKLENVSQLDVTGFSAVDLSAYDGIGAAAGNLSVDASTLGADFTAAFNATEADSSLDITGTNLDDNNITVTGGQYSDVTVNTGLGDDILVLKGDGAGVELSGNMGMGNNSIINLGTNWTLLDEEGNCVIQNADIIATEDSFTGTDVEWNSGTHAFVPAAEASGVVAITITQPAEDAGAQTIELYGNNIVYADDVTTLNVTATLGVGDTIVLGTEDSAITDNAKIIFDAQGSAENLNDVIKYFSVGQDILVNDAGLLSGFSYGTDYNQPVHSALTVTWAATGSADYGTDSASNSPITLTQSYNNQTLDNNKIYNLDDAITAASNDAAAVAALFEEASVGIVQKAGTLSANTANASDTVDSGDAGFFLSIGSKAVLAIDDGTGNTNLWYINNVDTAGVQEGEVHLIGTLQGVAVGDISGSVFGASA